MSKVKGFGIAAVLLAAPTVMLFEGLELRTYADPVGIPTACYGETSREFLEIKDTFTKEECTLALGASLAKHANEVAQCIKVPVKPYEAASIISWSYNIGTTAACRSTLVRKLNAGEEWCSELKRWVYADGRKLRGLEHRREAEYKMCIGDNKL